MRYDNNNITIPINQWTHFAIVSKPNDKIYVYKNNVLQTGASQNFSLVTSSSTLTSVSRLGYWYGSGDIQRYSGNIDDYRFYGVALTTSELTSVYNNTM
jgi:hypothetical protein